MIRRPPRSTLFPYTRSSDLRGVEARRAADQAPHRGRHAHYHGRIPRRQGSAARRICRSEEHTSELQSQSNLVCRLLLEKKKKKKKVSETKQNEHTDTKITIH